MTPYIPISISPKEIFEHIRKLSSRLKDRSENQLLEIQTRARHERSLYDYLAYLYSNYTLLEYDDMKFPEEEKFVFGIGLYKWFQ